MLINGKKLIGLPVYTKSGQRLGVVGDLEIDVDQQLIVNYQVSSKNVIKNLLNNKLVINRDQVIAINKDRIIVDDGILEEQTLLAKTEVRQSPEISNGMAASLVDSAEKN